MCPSMSLDCRYDGFCLGYTIHISIEINRNRHTSRLTITHLISTDLISSRQHIRVSPHDVVAEKVDPFPEFAVSEEKFQRSWGETIID